jgi:predicted AAA+ superfamily ATPase
MGGRTRSIQIHPFVYPEIKAQFDLKKILSFGTLPNVFFSAEPNAELTAYMGDYLQQEILAEALTRGVDQYSRFLSHIASYAVQTVNIDGLSRDSQLTPSSTRRYLEILSDTMIATQLECWKLGTKRKAASTTSRDSFSMGPKTRLSKLESVTTTPKIQRGRT